MSPLALSENLQDKKGWNNYTLIAQGRRLVHRINGQVVLDVIDDDPVARSKGIFALQLHAGSRLQVRFRDIRVMAL